MLTLDRPQDANLKTPEIARRVQVRVRPNGPVMDLPLGKTTIGSSPRCNIRMQQPGIQPLHCLILVDTNGPSVRRWAGETMLNGQPVEESSIGAGDWLRVGSVELEFVESQTVNTAAADIAAAPRPQATAPASLEPIAPSAPLPLVAAVQASAVRDRYRTSRDLAHSRSRRLLAALRQQRDTSRELQPRVVHLEAELERVAADRNDIAGQLQNLTSELAEARERSDSLRAELDAVLQRESAAAERADHLQRELSRLQQHSADLANQHGAIDRERDEAWSQCESLRSEMLAFSERETSLTETVSRLERENASQREHNIELSNQLSGRSNERDEAWRQCEALRSNVHTLSERESSLAETVARLENDSAQWQQQAADLSSQVATLSGERDEAWRQCETLRSEQRALNERESCLAQNVARLEHEIVKYQQQGSEFSNRLAEACGERDEAWRQCEALRDTARTLSRGEDEKASEIAMLSGERDAAWQQCEALRAEVQLLKEREDVLSQTAGRLEQEIGTLRSHETELSEQAAFLSSERDEARRQYESLSAELKALTEQEANLAETVRRFEQQASHHSNENVELTSQIGALRAEHDDLRDQNEQLRAQIATLAQERATFAEVQAAANRECESLRVQLHDAASTETRQSEQLAEFVAECRRLRDETDRLPQLEQQVRDAVADRENTSAELYRALLQLAEMQERDDHHAALQAAHQAVNAELEKSVQDIAQLQSKIDQLSEERIAENAARESLDRRTAELIEAHQQLAYDKSTLTAELAELRQQLDAARLRESELAASLEGAETWRQQLADSEDRLSRLQQTIARLQDELEGKTNLEASTASAIADRDRQISEFTRLLAESSEAVRLLERNAASADELQTEFGLARDTWRKEREEAERQRVEVAQHHALLLQRVEDLESQLAEAQTAARLAATSAAEASDMPTTDSSNNEPLDSAPLEARQTWSEQDADGGNRPRRQDDVTELATSVESRKYAEPAIGRSDGSPANDTPTPAPTAQPVSFIDRYSHMFPNDGAAEEPNVAPNAPQTARTAFDAGKTAGHARPHNIAPVSPGEDSDESVEEYMAKLLQRVRGDAPALALAMADATKPHAERVLPITAPTNFASAQLTTPPTNLGGDVPSLMGFDPGKRKSAMPAPRTDLEALRALANESARRAINRHAVRKHRRTMTTKVIVATLAGVTSLWLLLESERLWNLQFITAGVAMVVAAYWAAETFRTLLGSLRVKTIDETDEEIEELSAKLRLPLPIDIDSGRTWTSQPQDSLNGDTGVESAAAE